MRTTSLVKVTRQIALRIHQYPANLTVILAADATTRATVIAVLAHLLLEAAASDRLEEVGDDS